MAPHDDLLQNLCSSQETLNTAREIYNLAKQKTKQGSGFELGPHSTGLPAICAYIASTKLNNADVTCIVAQQSACLKTTDFNKALDTVKAALASASPKKSRGRGGEMLDLVIQCYARSFDRQLFDKWMDAVKNALIQSDERFGASNSDGPELKLAIFYWTYTTATGKALSTPEEFAEEHGIPEKRLLTTIRSINKCSKSVQAMIKNDKMAPRSPSKAAIPVTPRRSPKKPLRVPPTRDSPTKRKVEEPPVPPESDEEMGDPVPETPSKKRKIVSPTKPALVSPTKSALASPTKLIFPPVASSSRITLDTQPPTTPRRSSRRSEPQPQPPSEDEAMDVDEDVNNASTAEARVQLQRVEEEVERPIPRRFRSVYLDHKQWYAVDRRVKRMWKEAERYKASMVELHGPLEIRA